MAKKITCEQCGSKALSPIYNKQPTDDGLWWYRCAECKHVFTGEISKLIKRRLAHGSNTDCGDDTVILTDNISESSNGSHACTVNKPD